MKKQDLNVAATKTINGYTFNYICEINPQKDEFDKIKTYNPREKYNNQKNLALNEYGDSDFCIFDVETDITNSGVYVLFFGEELVYIGQAKNFKKRWSRTNYGSISPRNCFVGGQSTNCHINSAICAQSKKGTHIYLFFYSTKKYDEVERELIDKLTPELNISLNKKKCLKKKPL